MDYTKINDPTAKENENIKLVTCTPVMAKRDLHQGVPQSPFLQSNTIDKKDATPLLKGGGIIIQKPGQTDLKIKGGVLIRAPVANTKQQDKFGFFPKLPQSLNEFKD